MEAERRIGERLFELVQRQEKINARCDEMLKAVMAIKDRLQGSGGATAMLDVESSHESLVEEDDPIVQLQSLKQVSHVRSYIEAFATLNSKAGIQEDQALSLFLSGLVDEIRVPVCLYKPKTLDEAYALSKLQELTLTGVFWCDREESNLRRNEKLDVNSKVEGLKYEFDESSEFADMMEIDKEVSEGVSSGSDEGGDGLVDFGNSLNFFLHDVKAGKRLNHDKMKETELGHVTDFSEYNTFSQENKLKEAECVPSVRQIATVRDIAVTLNVVTNLTRLPVRYPKPMVKMKLMAHHGEVIEEDLNSMVFPISKIFKEARFLAIVLQNAMTRELVTTLIVVREVRLSVWNPKPKVKMKLMKFASRVGYEEETTDLGKAYKEVSEEISTALDKSGTEPSQWGSLSRVGWMPRPLGYDRWERMNENKDNYLFVLLLFQQESSILMAIKESSKMVSLEGNLLACQRIDGKYVERDERVATLEQTTVYIVEGDIDDVSRLKKLFELVSFTHAMHLASHAGVRYARENPSYYVHSNIVGSVKPQLSTVWASSSSVYGLNTNVSFSERDGTNQLARLYAAAKKAGKEIAHTYNHIHGLSITELRFFTCYGLRGRLGMTYFFFTRDILQGKSIPILEAASHETVAVGKSTGSSLMKKAYQFSDIDWLVSIWFPKPTVKMKHERLGSRIPCGQGILWGMECYDHNLSANIKDTWSSYYLIRDALPQAILERKMVKRHNQAVTQGLIHWDGYSPADASWEYADEIKARFPWFLEDKEP